MLSDSQKLSKGLIVYSVLISDFEKLDFKNDALAGVRANFFNSNKQTQADKTEISFEDKDYKISYSMTDGIPLSWKVSRNNQPFQSVKKISEYLYSVILYGKNGIVNKRIYFDNNHIWLRTEYFDDNFEGVKIGVLTPKIICDVFSIEFERISLDGSRFSTLLYPSATPPLKKCAGLVYTNTGMLWYDQIFAPKDLVIPGLGVNKIISGFEFNDDSSDFSNSDLVNFCDADYLEDNESYDEFKINNQANASECDKKSYSAYDKIQNILFEAQKTNKDLFGEIINQTSEMSADDNDSAQSNADLSDASDENESLKDLTGINESCVDTQMSDNSFESDDVLNEVSDKISDDVQITENIFDGDDTLDYEKQELADCNVIIHTKSGKYSYYGNVDKNNNRTGKGRTVTPDGITSYEGDYSDDKRNGFGVCYYKEGNINYVGNWVDGRREGCGVGYRLSDSTMHIGKWADNLPTEYGARFDSDGNFIDVCFYDNGVRNGKSVSFDEKGRVVIKTWADGELVSEFTVDEEE